MGTKFVIPAFVLLGVLNGCAGGGGGGNVATPFAPAPTPTPVSTTLPGLSVSVSGVVNTTNNSVTGLTAPATDASTTVTTVGTIGRQGATGDVSSATATTSNANGGNVTVNSNIVNSANFFGGYTNFNNSVANPGISASTATLGVGGTVPAGITAQSYSYVAFGNWLQCTANCTGTTPTLNAGYFVYGSETPAGSIPITGFAIYNGTTQGTYTDASGAQFATESALTVNADFLNRSLSFTTASSYTAPNSTTLPTANNSLNMSGTLSYPSNSNTFTGIVTDNGGRTGSATGRFYGPTANEVGGVYGVTGAAGTNVGSFAAKQ